MKQLYPLFIVGLVLVPHQATGRDVPSYQACFKAQEAQIQAEAVGTALQAEEVDNADHTYPASTTPENSQLQDKLNDGVTLHINPDDKSATPKLEVEGYKFDTDKFEDGDAPKGKAPKNVKFRDLCKTLYGIQLK